MENTKKKNQPETRSQEKNPLNEIFWRDEILQVLFWYRGEGLGEAITLRELGTFLPASDAALSLVLKGMVEDGYLVKEKNGSQSSYSFTPLGSKEGGRRFADEFAELTHQAHGECNDPKCDCKVLGPGACTVTGTHSHN